MNKIEYFVKCINYDENYQLWRHRYFKKQFAPLWEKLNPEYDNIEEIIKTHKYKYDTYPDNDCFHIVIEYTVEIKKVTTIIELL
jgi:hypothetical protein